MLYFAYGSNMSIKRLCARAPSARFVTVAKLSKHILKFHKAGQDGSGKCDAFETGDMDDFIMGVVFEIDASEKPVLDRKEGLGQGYEVKDVVVTSRQGASLEAFTYTATNIRWSLKPYHWYKAHVLRGAEENGLPESYIQEIARIASDADPKPERHASEMAIYL
ncbi:MAG: gamma-glutamylcyclotransferase family protein [Nitrospiria bacterium]